jgi:hypothetical protein
MMSMATITASHLRPVRRPSSPDVVITVGDAEILGLSRPPLQNHSGSSLL